MAFPDQCPFCHLQKEQSRLLHDGERVYVILSNPRLAAGHCLVIPKRHVEKIASLTPEERLEVFDVLASFEEKILSAYASGCDIRQHYRPFIKQSEIKVDHLHFHLIPRESEDATARSGGADDRREDELYREAQRFERELFRPLRETEQKKFMELFGAGDKRRTPSHLLHPELAEEGLL